MTVQSVTALQKRANAAGQLVELGREKAPKVQILSVAQPSVIEGRKAFRRDHAKFRPEEVVGILVRLRSRATRVVERFGHGAGLLGPKSPDWDECCGRSPQKGGERLRRADRGPQRHPAMRRVLEETFASSRMEALSLIECSMDFASLSWGPSSGRCRGAARGTAGGNGNDLVVVVGTGPFGLAPNSVEVGIWSAFASQIAAR